MITLLLQKVDKVLVASFCFCDVYEHLFLIIPLVVFPTATCQVQSVNYVFK
jgi:hypothetical protein